MMLRVYSKVSWFCICFLSEVKRNEVNNILVTSYSVYSYSVTYFCFPSYLQANLWSNTSIQTPRYSPACWALAMYHPALRRGLPSRRYRMGGASVEIPDLREPSPRSETWQLQDVWCEKSGVAWEKMEMAQSKTSKRMSLVFLSTVVWCRRM